MNFNENQALAKIVRETAESLRFNIFEIGAMPVENSSEPFHNLLDFFPGSNIYAFEVDEEVCGELDKKAKPGMKYYPAALGRTVEKRSFYETNHPVCASLYKPNDKLNSMYNKMEFAYLKSVRSIQTVNLDVFTKENKISTVDFIKIDIQGAELDVFQGGSATLENTVAIVSEVEFIPIYERQPLFGDICAYLSGSGFIFHKFLGIVGRTLKPIILNNNPGFATQHMWADALFIKDIAQLNNLSSDQLLKMGIMAFIYDSVDIAIFCFSEYDRRNGKGMTQKLLSLCNVTS